MNAGGPNHLRQTANQVWGSSRRTAALQQHHTSTWWDSNPFKQQSTHQRQRDLRRLSLQLLREGREPCKQQAYSISTHRDPRTSLAKAGMGMDGNHASSTNSHYYRSPCTASTRGGRKPLQKQHTAIQHTAGPRTLEFAAGMGMDGNHGNSTCTHQHLASQRNSIYSTTSTLYFQLLPCT